MLSPGEKSLPVNGVYANQPPFGGCPTKKLAYMKIPASTKIQ